MNVHIDCLLRADEMELLGAEGREGEEAGEDLMGDGREAGEGDGDGVKAAPAKKAEALKQPGLRNEYTQAIKAGIVPLTEAFGLSPRQYAENAYYRAYNRSLTAEPKLPRDLARTFICTYAYTHLCSCHLSTLSLEGGSVTTQTRES